MADLSVPVVAAFESFAQAVQEYQAEGRWRRFDAAVLTSTNSFNEYVDFLRREEFRQVDGVVGPRTVLWWLDGDMYLGELTLWHVLAEGRLGHVSYEVRPSVRGKGHARAMLAAAIPIAASKGINPLLVEVDASNKVSQRVIENNQGVLIADSGDSLIYQFPNRP